MQTIKERAEKMLNRMQECKTHLDLLEKASQVCGKLEEGYRIKCDNAINYWIGEYDKAEIEMTKSVIDVSTILIQEEKESRDD